jgi:hypothetical protein
LYGVLLYFTMNCKDGLMIDISFQTLSLSG